MKKLYLFATLLIAVWMAGILEAQTQFTPVPDCQLNFNFVKANGATQNSLTYTNYPASGGNGGGICTTWVMSYTTSVVTTTITVELQSADVATGQLTPGAFGAYAGTVVTGSANPTTTLVGGQAFFTNSVVATPFLRIQVRDFVDVGGRVWGQLYGYKAGAVVAGGGGGACPAGVSGSPQFTNGTNCIAGTVHGAATRVVQISDGTGTVNHLAKFDASGNVTNGPTAGGVCPAGAANSPQFTDGTDCIAGTRHGNTTRVQTSDNTGTSQYLAAYDANGNTTDSAGTGVAFAGLATPSNGAVTYCTDCTVTSGSDDTCAASGSGANAKRVNGAWRCSI